MDFPGGSDGKESSCNAGAQKTWVQSLGWENPPEEGMSTHSSVLTWRIPWTEEPGKLQSMGSWESDDLETKPPPPPSTQILVSNYHSKKMEPGIFRDTVNYIPGSRWAWNILCARKERICSGNDANMKGKSSQIIGGCSSVPKSYLILCNPMDCSRLSPGVFSNSCPLSWWCHPTISSCLQSFPASGASVIIWLFTSDGQSIGASPSASVLLMNIQGWLH